MITSNLDNFSLRIVWITSSVSILYEQPSYTYTNIISAVSQHLNRT